jgi:hypothetical protein
MYMQTTLFALRGCRGMQNKKKLKASMNQQATM